MIAVSKTVVEEWAMVVEHLYALVTDRAVKRSLRLDHLAVRAKIIQVEADVEGYFY